MLGGSSCTTTSSSPTQQKSAVASNKKPHVESFWKGDGVSGSPKIEIDLSKQAARYYKGGQLVGQSPISSGREGHDTRSGTYRIMEKDLDHRSSLYGAFVDSSDHIVVEDVDARRDKAPPGTRFKGASMRYFMRVTGAVGMHEGYLPGYPASHGCIRLPSHMASTFFHATPSGTPVVIIGNAADAESTQPVHDPVLGYPPGTQPAATTAPTPATKAKAKSSGIFAAKKKPAKPAPLRGQTLYLE